MSKIQYSKLSPRAKEAFDAGNGHKITGFEVKDGLIRQWNGGWHKVVMEESNV